MLAIPFKMRCAEASDGVAATTRAVRATSLTVMFKVVDLRNMIVFLRSWGVIRLRDLHPYMPPRVPILRELEIKKKKTPKMS